MAYEKNRKLNSSSEIEKLKENDEYTTGKSRGLIKKVLNYCLSGLIIFFTIGFTCLMIKYVHLLFTNDPVGNKTEALLLGALDWIVKVIIGYFLKSVIDKRKS